jgi:hypothetical protein
MAPLLSEIEDRALALCEGEYVEFPLATQILESWFARSISVSELRSVFERLAQLGLIECQVRNSWAFGNLVPEAPVIWQTKFRTTSKGEGYLNGY